MQALLLSAAPSPRPPLPALRRRSLPSIATASVVASAPCVSAPRRAAAFRGASAAAAAGRGSLPHLAAAASSASGPVEPTPLSAEEEVERAKLAQISKRLEKTARYFKSLGTLGFWSQLVCTTFSAGILSFSAVATGNATAPFTFYATQLAPPRAAVIKNLRNGIVLNVLGMGATVLGMQATVGDLVAKALTTSAVPYYQGISPGQSPVPALDVFLVQASANTILSHFLELLSSLELLRSVTLSSGSWSSPSTSIGISCRPGFLCSRFLFPLFLLVFWCKFCLCVDFFSFGDAFQPM